MARLFFARWPSGRFVHWRSLSFSEFRGFQQRLERGEPAASVYLDAYALAYVEGAPVEGDPLLVATGGMVLFVGEALIARNPFTGSTALVEEALAQKRQEVGSNYLLACRGILAALFHYSFEEIDTWDAATFFERVAQAEIVSGKPLDVAGPEKPKTQKGKPDPAGSRVEVEQQVSVRRNGPPPASSGEGTSNKRPLTSAQRMVLERKQSGH